MLIAEYGNAPASGSGGLHYYHSDRLSTRMITSGNSGTLGNLLGTQDHLPFGEDAGVWQESGKHRFTKYASDLECGTRYAINRQYSQNTGRFLRPDPIEGSPEKPQSFNRYTYSVNEIRLALNKCRAQADRDERKAIDNAFDPKE